jgi:hypothetical protein
LETTGFCGNALFPSNQSRAFLVLTNLAAFPAGSLSTNHLLPRFEGVTNLIHRSAAFSLNADCSVVGWASLNNGSVRAAMWLPGATNAIDLNTKRQAGYTKTLTAAYGINPGGIIVGDGTDSSGNTASWIAYPIFKKH